MRTAAIVGSVTIGTDPSSTEGHSSQGHPSFAEPTFRAAKRNGVRGAGIAMPRAHDQLVGGPT